MTGKPDNWKRIRKNMFSMVSVGVIDEPINQAYDVISTGSLIINLVAAILNTYDSLNMQYGSTFLLIEKIMLEIKE